MGCKNCPHPKISHDTGWDAAGCMVDGCSCRHYDPTAPLTEQSEALLEMMAMAIRTWGPVSEREARSRLAAIEAAVRAEADVLRAAIPEDPWRYTPGISAEAWCYDCGATRRYRDDKVVSEEPHDSCAWLAARAIMEKS